MGDYIFKIVLAGEGGVGKTSLITRYVDNKFEHGYKLTIGVSHSVKSLEIGEHKVTFQIWDMGGQEHFRVITNSMFRATRGVFYVFDLTRPSSLDKLEDWIKINKENNVYYDECPAILIGNKLDLYYYSEERVDENSINRFLERNADANIKKCYYTSAKTGEYVNEAFTDLARLILENVISKDK